MFSSFQPPFTPGHVAGFQNGLYRRVYTGNFDGVTTWFATATKTGTDLIVGSIGIPSIAINTSCEFLGWFKAPYSENFTFTLASDDKSLLWIGNNAKAGNFNAGNALVTADVGSNTGVISLTKGVYYALRLQNGNGLGPGYVSLAVSSPSLVSTQNLTGLSYFNPNTQGI